MATLTHGLPEIKVTNWDSRPDPDKYPKLSRSMSVIMNNPAIEEMLRTGFPPEDQANNGQPLTCISCGAKTDARGSLPCGH